MDFTMTPNMLTGKQCPTTLIDFIYKTEKQQRQHLLLTKTIQNATNRFVAFYSETTER
jgi:hypothetical protein